MHGRSKVLNFSAALIVSGMCAFALSAAGPAVPQATIGGPVLKIETLTKAQFRALSPNQLISYKGQVMTKAAFMAQRFAAWSKNQATMQESLQKLHAKFAAAQADLAHRQRADLAARNAKVLAELSKFQQQAALLAQSPSYVALSREAAQLVARYAVASSAEKAQLKLRASQLYNQLRQMELKGESQ